MQDYLFTRFAKEAMEMKTHVNNMQNLLDENL